MPATANRAPSQTTSTTKNPGSADLGGVEQRLQPADLDAGLAHPLGLAGVAVVEDPLAADAAQHPQPGDDVGGEVGEVAHHLAVPQAAALQRPEQRRDRAA